MRDSVSMGASEKIHADSSQVLERPGNRLRDVFAGSFDSLFKSNQNLYQLFFSIVKKLNKFFSLSRAILVVRSPKDNNLKVIALKGQKIARQGLALTLPEKNSLLYNVCECCKMYTQNFPTHFEGNFIEKKLLIDDETSSIAICPIRNNGSIHGLLCLASPIIYAFDMFGQGFLDSVLEQFGRRIKKEIDRLHI